MRADEILNASQVDGDALGIDFDNHNRGVALAFHANPEVCS